MPKYESMFERLLANSTEGESPTACWTWTGRCEPKGYGRLNVREGGQHTKRYAHREMHYVVDGEYIEIHLDDDPFGPFLMIPAARLGYDETIDHLCWNTQCIHPDHFEVVSRSENSIRKEAR